MKIKNLLTTLVISTIISMSTKVYAVVVWVPQKVRDSAKGSFTQVVGSRSVLDMISMVNSYLWFAIGFFCFVFMIWNGFKLISANGDEKSMESSKKALIGSGIGIAVCLLAYIIVNLAVKLFA